MPSWLMLSLYTIQVPQDFDGELFRLCLGVIDGLLGRRVLPAPSRVSLGVDFTDLGNATFFPKLFLRASSPGAVEQGHALCLDDSISASKFMSSYSAIELGEVEFAQCFLRAFEHPTIAEVYKAITF